MAVTSAWIPGLCGAAAGGVAVLLAPAAIMADERLVGARLADGPKMLARFAVAGVEDAGAEFSDWNTLPNGVVVVAGPVVTGVGLPGFWTGAEVTGCRTTGGLVGCIVTAECIAILIRGFIGISFAAPNPLKTRPPEPNSPPIFSHPGNFSARGVTKFVLASKREKGVGMKFLLIVLILATAAFAGVDRCGARWARHEARQARSWARDARREAHEYRQEARHYAAEARREAREYRQQLRRDLRDSFRHDRF